jgi:predicted ATPase/class 3 adenylate cyclase
MRHLPDGTVTLLFTDIEGSTRLLQQVGTHYAALLQESRQLMRTAFERWHGQEVDTQGDAFFVVFARASDAACAAVDIQRALAVHPWPDGAAIRVRIGLHTGEPQRFAGGYVGLDVHHAARIMSAGHGGQILLSQATGALVEHNLPDGVQLQDLGEHRLKDLQRPTHLFQLAIAGLPNTFPPLRTLDSHPTNLPIEPTPFIGREREVATLLRLLARPEVRLLTLTGPGGVGKTRLALHVAAESSDEYPDGVFVVPLAPLTNPQQVIETIAQVLSIPDVGGLSLFSQVQQALKPKQLLLVLDNFEQVAAAAPLLAELLATCPSLKIIVTSRVALHVRAEQEFSVPPLSLPDLKHLPGLATLSQSEAVAFFIERARAVKHTFELTGSNAPAVAAICTRLDGLPLAIELAAARIKFFPPQLLLSRLEQGSALLAGGPRDLPARQQTLRNTIQWSYDLLSEIEQRLFRQLSVFVDGCTLEAVEAVCNAQSEQAIDVLDGILSLADKSLLRQEEQEGVQPRFLMLQTIREYGLECLQQYGETASTRRAHALYYLRLAEEAEPHLKGPQQDIWLRHLERERENLRAALHWACANQETGLALRLCGACWWFWFNQGELLEGRRWLEAALRLPGDHVDTRLRIKALYAAGYLAFTLDETAIARERLEESVALARQAGDSRGLAQGLSYLGTTICEQGDLEAGCTLLQESVTLARESGEQWVYARSLLTLGRMMWVRSDHAAARPLIEESLKVFERIGDKHGLAEATYRLSGFLLDQGNLKLSIPLMKRSLALARQINGTVSTILALCQLGYQLGAAGDREQQAALLAEGLALARDIGYKAGIMTALSYLAQAAQHRGDLFQAEQYARECLSLVRETGKIRNITFVLYTLGCIVRDQGDLAEATRLFEEGFALAQKIHYRLYIGWNLIGLATVAAAAHNPMRAARLFGAAEGMLDNEMAANADMRSSYERYVNAVRSQLDENAFAAAWAEGQELTPEEALTAQNSPTDPLGK